MRSGRLDRRVVIQRLTVTTNEVGEQVDTWSELATVWSERSPRGVVQKFNANQVYAEVDTVFRTRWYPWATTLDPMEHRLVYRSRVYDIHGTEEIGRREGVMILTKARSDNESGEP